MSKHTVRETVEHEIELERDVVLDALRKLTGRKDIPDDAKVAAGTRMLEPVVLIRWQEEHQERVSKRNDAL